MSHSSSPGTGRSANHKAQNTTLVLFAAASLTECLDSLVETFEQAHPTVDVKASYAGTQELRIQVEHGAVCDVFISANRTHMDALVGGKHVVKPHVLGHNKLCVAVDPRSDAIKSLADLAKPGVRLVVATPACPAGRYTRECWRKLGESAEFGGEFLAGLHRNVVSQETNVKLVLSKVILGVADACFVYGSDVIGQKVKRLDLPESVQVRATYLVGVGSRAQSPEAAELFIETLLSEVGREALAAAGLEAAYE